MAIAHPFHVDARHLRVQEPFDLRDVEMPGWRMLATGEDDFLAHGALAEARRRRATARGAKWSAATARLAWDIANTRHARGRGVSRWGRAIMAYAVGLDSLVGRRDAVERVLQERGYRRAKDLPPPRIRRVPAFLMGGSPLAAAHGAVHWRQVYDLVKHPEAKRYEKRVETFWREVGFEYLGRSPFAPRPSSPATIAAVRAGWRSIVPHEQDLLPPDAAALAVSALYDDGGDSKVARTARHAAFLLVTEPKGITTDALACWSEALKRPADC